MNLAVKPFIKIKEGKKTIEMRLNNKDRNKIKSGDQILFTNQSSGEQILTDVISVSRFSSFDELYGHFDKTRLGYEANETADPKDMLIYYNEHDIVTFGVLAIEIKLNKL